MSYLKRWRDHFMQRTRSYVGRWWFLPMVFFLTFIDAYVFVVPNELFLIPVALDRKKKWIRTTLWVTLGSALGAASFAALVSTHGAPFVERSFPELLRSAAWEGTESFIQKHGLIGLALISVSPFPQHPASAIVGLAHMNPLFVLIAVFVGRGIKYLFISWAALNAPHFLKKMGIKL